MPATVGVDIGCGMAAVRTQLTKDDVAELAAAGRGLGLPREAIEAAVPVSKGGYNRSLSATAAARVAELEALAERSQQHGAGRNFSRRAARQRFTVAQLTEAMTGIEWRAENAEAFLDEIPGAYKDIDQVMEDAKDLVTVDHTLRQVLNVKGD